jgi:hypothetical protein
MTESKQKHPPFFQPIELLLRFLSRIILERAAFSAFFIWIKVNFYFRVLFNFNFKKN